MTPTAPLARRIARGTSALIFTGIVLVGGLSFGRTILDWWRTDGGTNSPVRAFEPFPRLDSEQPLRLQWGGDAGEFEIRHGAGDANAATRVLAEACRAPAKTGAPLQAETTTAEETLLRRLADSTPVQAEDDWRLHGFQGGLPLLVATRKVQDRFRIVAWGFYLARGDSDFVLYILHKKPNPASTTGSRGSAQSPAKTAKTSEVDESSPEDLPQGFRLTLALESADGGRLLAFRAQGSSLELKRAIANWFEGLDAKEASEWNSGGGWGGEAKILQDGRWSRAHLQASPDPRGGWIGLLSITGVENAQP